jgi:alcohol dehydrogenase
VIGRSYRPRPQGALRHYSHLLTPGGAAGMRLAAERDAAQRLGRLLDAGRDRVRERLRPSRAKMRALSAAPGGRLRWSSAPAPRQPGTLGAIVHPIAAATCDLDCGLVLGATQFPLPLHLGHECVAEVLAVGEQVATVRVGDRVIVPFQINCGICTPCSQGHTGSCASVPPASMYGFGLTGGHWGGAFSDELAVPYADAMLVPLPQGVEPAVAASVADNICDAYRHLAPHLPGLLERDPNAEVLILGVLKERAMFSSSVPMYAALIAQALGARNVVLVDGRPHARAHARCAVAPRLRWWWTSASTASAWRSRAPPPTGSAPARVACTAARASRCCRCTHAMPPSTSAARTHAR